MEANQFDRLTRRVATPATRRAALGLAAMLGLGAGQGAVGKKRKKKNGCKGGCPACHVCQKQGKKKICVTAPDGTACEGGACQAGICTCVPRTCQERGNVCGPIADECGGEMTCSCGVSATPACDNGRCATCATTCPASCQWCYARIDGTTRCGAFASYAGCEPCASDTDCPPASPYCVTTITSRPAAFTQHIPSSCGISAPGVCASIDDC